MKIYVASRSQTAGRKIGDLVRSAGHVIVARWLDEPGYEGLPADETRRRRVAVENLTDVRSADLLILRAEPDGSFVPGGKHVESGAALALGIPVIVLGPPENVFHWHPLVVLAADEAEMLKRIESLSRAPLT
jgi:hypothetical protein